MLISETEYKHQVETDIRPFHDVLLGLFFITIGMMLDWRLVLDRWPHGAAAGHACRCCSRLVLITVLARGFGLVLGHFAAHRSVPGAGGRIRLRAADAGATQRPGAAGLAQPDPGQHGAVDAGNTPSSSCTATASS
jgi:Kef-type K+ transport system membrane component KefB